MQRLAGPLAVLVLSCLCACDSNPAQPVDAGLPDADSTAGDRGSPDRGPDQGPPPGPAPGAEFDRFCAGRTWWKTLQPATVGKLAGKYLGHLTGLDATTPWKPHTFEMMKVVPPYPFQVTKIRVAFAKGEGPARLRLMNTFGRSYPAAFPNLLDESKDLLPPRQVEVKAPDPEKWLELDVSAQGIFLQPTQHYMIVYDHVAAAPYLAMEEVPKDEQSRALLLVPTSVEAYGVPGNYRLELVGNAFCAWSDSERLFTPQAKASAPFSDEPSWQVAVVDLDGDGHDDVVIGGGNLGGPKAYLGDGKGAFSKPAKDPFAVAPGATFAVYGDVDNDGDQDAFAGYYVSRDGDGDGYEVGGVSPADCNDAEADVHPGATEVKNGRDDDCDGVADDGTDTSDADQDGHSIAAGDCDDTRKDVHPGAPELLDGRDNDCDKLVDEDFTHRVLLNDGKGSFVVAPGAGGVAALEPATAAAFGDANGDGKLDLYWGNWLKHYPDDAAVQDRYFEGKGDGTFTDAQAKAGLTLPIAYSPYGLGWTDYNNDGWLDLFVANYHMYPNQLWKNLGNGVFVDVGEQAGVARDDIPGPQALLTGGHSYGAAWGDVDNDGDLDAYICNLAHPRVQPWGDPSMFVVNSGAPGFTFTNQLKGSGFIYDEGDVSAAWADFDNDGDLDLAIASLYTGHYSRLYRNDGAKGFVDVTYEAGVAVHDAVTVAWADVDEDGDLDLLIADRDGVPPNVHLFLNQARQQSGWVELDLRGTTSNAGAYGARVTLTSGTLTQLREVAGGASSGNSQVSRLVHFGLGAATSVDALTVRWLGGKTETITGAKPRGRYRIVEGSGKAVAY